MIVEYTVSFSLCEDTHFMAYGKILHTHTSIQFQPQHIKGIQYYSEYGEFNYYIQIILISLHRDAIALNG